ncbi:hypothetical protein DCC26_07990 [Auritidibacter sp. NML120779]|nr:hypothetical protein DCC26_07990 [Auritidibacter sp. NML120779]
MRIHRLEIQAIGPFAQREVIEFDRLNQAGLFLLDGPTGSGKSTILATLTFALYGTVPGERKTDSLHSTLAGSSTRPEVVLDVSVAERRFLITRSPSYQRPSKRAKNGVVKENSTVSVSELLHGAWREVTTRADEAGQLMNAVLGLTAEQFMRVILLPQGEFAAFLHASSSERQALLRKLFDTARFEQVEDALKDERDALERHLGSETDRITSLRHDVITTISALTQEAWWAENQAPESAEELDDETLATRATETMAGLVASAHHRQQELSTTENTLRQRVETITRDLTCLDQATSYHQRRNQHEHQREQISLVTQQLAAHRVAEPVWRAVQAVCRTAQVVQDQAKALAETFTAGQDHPLIQTWARAAELGVAQFAEHLDDLGESDAGLQALRQGWNDVQRQADRAVDRLSDRHQQAREIRELADSITGGERELEELDETLQVRKNKREEMAGQLRELAGNLEELHGTEERLEAAEQRHQQTETALTAARARQTAKKTLSEEQHKHHDAVDQAQRAVDTYQRLVQARLDAAAELLAEELVQGQPCAVCGSIEHPAPAQGQGLEEISQHRVEQARQRADELHTARVQQDKVLQAARDEHERLLAASSGVTPEEASQTRDEAKEHVVQLRKDVQRYRQLVQDQQRAEQAIEKITTMLPDLEAQRTATATTLEAQRERQEKLQEQLHKALGSYASVSELQDHTEQAHRLVAAISQRLDQLGVAVARRDQAITSRDLALKQAQEHVKTHRLTIDASSVEAITAAVMEDRSVTEAEQQVTDWDAESARLAELAEHEHVVHGLDLLAQHHNDPAQHPLPSQQVLSAHRQQLEETIRNRQAADSRRGTVEHAHQQVTAETTELHQRSSQTAEVAEKHQQLDDLLKLVRGQGENSYKMSLGSYVLTGRLEKVAAAASERLERMTQGRYSLEHDDAGQSRGKSGLDLQVRDHLNDTYRAPATLSGGESFMASLALALGLADTVQAEAGGITMDTLFIDEGFGSLDSETLEQVMEVLNGLGDDGRTIGLVSHVESMKHQIPTRVRVTKTPRGVSNLELVQNTTGV